MFLGFFLCSKLWIWSCTLDENIAQTPPCCRHRYPPLSCCHHIAPASSSRIFPYVLNRTYTKIYIFEKFMKLPFQRLVIHLKRSSYEWAMVISILVLRAVQKISECTTFNVWTVPTCRKLRLTWFLIRCNVNFVELLNIQNILLLALEVELNVDENNVFLWVDPKMSMNLILWFFGVSCCASLGSQGHHHLFTSECRGSNDESST
jgi:hypothetical protein